jgi:hypothetical protein
MNVLRHSGSYLKRKAVKNLLSSFLCLLAFAGLLLTSTDISPFYVNLGNFAIARLVLMLILLLVGVFWFFPKYGRYMGGSEGEKRVTRVLRESLNDDYFLIDDLQLFDGRKGNIDHVVVGPNGVFVIETKNLRGKVFASEDYWQGTKGKSPSKQVRDNANRVYHAIKASESFRTGKPWVHGIVVFTNRAAQLNIQKPPFNVAVLRLNALANYITATKPLHYLSRNETEAIAKEILTRHRKRFS